jgi:hypothetical protein
MHASISARTAAVLPRIPISLIHRVKAQYTEMPDLSLTPWQASRLLGLDVDICGYVLHALAASGFLQRGENDHYRRRQIH